MYVLLVQPGEPSEAMGIPGWDHREPKLAPVFRYFQLTASSCGSSVPSEHSSLRNPIVSALPGLWKECAKSSQMLGVYWPSAPAARRGPCQVVRSPFEGNGACGRPASL